MVTCLTAKDFEDTSDFFCSEALKLVCALSFQVPPDHQSLDANQDPTAPVPTAASADNCPL